MSLNTGSKNKWLNDKDEIIRFWEEERWFFVLCILGEIMGYALDEHKNNETRCLTINIVELVFF